MGHAIQTLRLQRPPTSVLQAVYRALRGPRRGWTRIDWEVRKELMQVRALNFFCAQDLAKPFSDLVHVSDSSTSGDALMYRRGPLKVIRQDCRWHERWRFLEVEPLDFAVLLAGGFVEECGLCSPLGGERSDHAVFASNCV